MIITHDHTMAVFSTQMRSVIMMLDHNYKLMMVELMLFVSLSYDNQS